jgi:uncharacterized protein
MPKNVLTHAARMLATSLLLALSMTLQAQESPQTNLPRTTLKAGMHLIQAQVASTPQQRATGLMHRQDMPANEGMLFVFESPAVQCFWMKNTLIPLTAAFVADDGTSSIWPTCSRSRSTPTAPKSRCAMFWK